MKVSIQNPGNGNVLANSADIARSDAARAMGLLGRSSLNAGEGLWIVPGHAIHTYRMQFPIDVLFLDASQCVLDCAPDLQPNIQVEREGAHSVLEIPAGCIAASGTEVGDYLMFSEIAELPSTQVANGAGVPGMNAVGILVRGLGLAEQYGFAKAGTGSAVRDLLDHAQKFRGVFQGGGQ